MIGPFLQAGIRTAYLGYLALLALTLVAITMSAFIVFQAYRGSRRNDSRRMFFLAVGLALLTVVPFTLSLLVTGLSQVFDLGPTAIAYYLPIAIRLVEIGGLLSLLYSLYVDR